MINKYGFYESIDYTISRLKYGEKNKIVKTYMAHHEALSLISINNLINNNIIVDRFMKNPEIQSISVLLQERMPEKAIITKEKKEKIKKIKPKDYQNYIEKVYTNTDNNLNNGNTISNGKYTVFTKANGEGFSKYKDLLINRFKETSDYNQGIVFYIKNLKNKTIWVNTQIDRDTKSNIYKTVFAPERSEFVRVDGSIETKTKIVVSPDNAVEIRRLELKNNGTEEETLEVTNLFEPVLSKPMQDYTHMAFNNLFLTFEKVEDGIIVKRKKRLIDEKDVYLGVTFFTEHETLGELEYEIDKEKMYMRKYELIPDMVKESKPFSKNLGLVTDPCLAMKQSIKIKPKETVILDLAICISYNKEEILNLLSKYKNSNVITKIFELAKAKTEAETIYLGLKGKDIEKYQKLLSYLLINNPLKKNNNVPDKIYSQSKLWKYGISGDLPILLVKIENLNDMYVVKDALKAYEFYLSKNIKLDLVILNEEENSYDQYINYEIENAILNKQMQYLKNRYGGIFVININQIEKDDINLLEFKANFILDAKLGDIKSRIEDLEEEYLKSLKNVGEDEQVNYLTLKENNNLNIDLSNLKYYNEFGGFTEDGLEYKIKLEKNKKLPTTWSMILANKTFGTLITQNLGGYTWHKNSRLNRLSSWNNNANFDTPSEIIYLKDYKTGNKWTLSNNLNDENEESYLTYGFGYAKYEHTSNKIQRELITFIPENEKIKISLLKLKNLDLLCSPPLLFQSFFARWQDNAKYGNFIMHG